MDYKSLHLAWIRKTTSFTPKYSYDYGVPYYDVIVQLYKNPRVNQEVASMFFKSDMRWFEACNKDIATLRLRIRSHEVMQPLFITIGFNHQTWDIPSCVKVIETIVNFHWIDTCCGVFELHRSNGIHPHVHFLMTLACPLAKSKVLEKLWATAGLKKVCLGKSFIDYKIAEQYHSKYILGEKQDSKMPFVEQDIQWRKQNNINDYFCKNYNI